MKLKIIWKLFPTFLILVVLSIGFVSFFISDAIKVFHIEQTKKELTAKAILLEEIYSREIAQGKISEIDGIFKKAGKSIATRITLILKDGTVIADSAEDIYSMENHADRPEIIDALNGINGTSIRYSKTLKKDMLYVAVQLNKDEQVRGVIRTSVPLLTLVETLKPVFSKFSVSVGLTALLAALFSLLISWLITRPITKIQMGVEHFSQGDLDKKLETSSTYEFAKLAEDMNHMALDLKYRIDTITRQRNELARLENIRKEFVANVSHELRTPITSIKGYIETLKDGALDDRENALQFLDIISRQTSRLSSIIEDLLALSRIERENEAQEVELAENFISPVLSAACNTVKTLAEKKSIALVISSPESLKAMLNPRLLEQAVMNLVDNAVKYSEPDSKVEISAISENGNIQIKVKDYGCGIEKEHHDRLFERFYRVDKARSRKLGGTGLGLAIVKHIVQSHHGSVTVESAPGKGSTFTITIPKK